MAQSAPAVGRIAATLTFLAEHPDESFTLSELCRELRYSPATAHALLSSLVAEGFLLREPISRKYSLGPALIQIGSAAALRQENVLEFARAELARLATALGRQCIITQVIGQRIVLVARAGPAGPMGATMQVGKRLPFEPPLGTIFLAWSDREEIEMWLRGISPDSDRRAIRKCMHAIDVVRERGYSVSLDVRPRPDPLARAGLEHMLNSHYFLDTIDNATAYPVTQIAAPIFDSTGRVVIALCCPYVGELATGEQVRNDAAVIVSAAGRVTETIRGRVPAAHLAQLDATTVPGAG